MPLDILHTHKKTYKMKEISEEIARKLGADISRIQYPKTSHPDLWMTIFRVQLAGERLGYLPEEINADCFVLTQNEDPETDDEYVVAILKTTTPKLIVKQVNKEYIMIKHWTLAVEQSITCIIISARNEFVSLSYGETKNKEICLFTFNKRSTNPVN